MVPSQWLERCRQLRLRATTTAAAASNPTKSDVSVRANDEAAWVVETPVEGKVGGGAVVVVVDVVVDVVAGGAIVVVVGGASVVVVGAGSDV